MPVNSIIMISYIIVSRNNSIADPALMPYMVHSMELILFVNKNGRHGTTLLYEQQAL